MTVTVWNILDLDEEAGEEGINALVSDVNEYLKGVGLNRLPSFLEEYGEGVDCMCKELEAIGLPDPVFNNNTFILKTTIMSASFESETTENTSIQHDFASIG